MSGIRFVKNTYLKLMTNYPFPMQAVQSGLLMGLGDFIAQSVIEEKDLNEINLRRTLNYSAVGLIVVGPVLSKWYVTLDKIFGQNGIKTALKKILIDQTCFAPCFIPVIMSAISITEGKSMQDIKIKIQTDYTDVMSTNYKVWPFVQLINFYFIPLNYRVILVQFVALGWNTYLSWKMSNHQFDNEDDDDDVKDLKLKQLPYEERVTVQPENEICYIRKS